MTMCRTLPVSGNDSALLNTESSVGQPADSRQRALAVIVVPPAAPPEPAAPPTPPVPPASTSPPPSGMSDAGFDGFELHAQSSIAIAYAENVLARPCLCLIVKSVSEPPARQ